MWDVDVKSPSLGTDTRPIDLLTTVQYAFTTMWVQEAIQIQAARTKYFYLLMIIVEVSFLL